MSQKIVIPDSAAGERLDIVLANLTGASRSAIQKLFKAGKIEINGEPLVAKQQAIPGQVIFIGQLEVEEMPPSPQLEVLFEDNDLLVVEKPSGLAVHLSESGRAQATVAAFAKDYGVIDDEDERPGIVHRLDKDTSGLLVIAKNPEAKSFLQGQFRNRKVEKTYLALVRGRMASPQATINLPIERDRKQPTKRAVVPGGRASVTHYQVIEEFEGFSLLEIKLETGRTHQIRVHFSHLGHPVAGDELYGGPHIKGLKGQFLHASKISFIAPSEERIDIESPLPENLKNILESLREKV
jgi:23S rRNA pseudouridine1911/1915/1917 synthase